MFPTQIFLVNINQMGVAGGVRSHVALTWLINSINKLIRLKNLVFSFKSDDGVAVFTV